MKILVESIRFRVDVYFPNADVDAVFAEKRYGGTLTLLAGDIKHKVTSKTPTSASIDNFLDKLHDSPELKQLGVSIVEWHGLMMGGCHFSCEVDYNNFSHDLVEKVKKLAQKILGRTVRYYKHSNILLG